MYDYLDLESTTNPRVKAWASLARRSERDRTGIFLIEGTRESLRAKDLLDIVEIIVCPEYVSDDILLPTATTVSTRVFDKISRRQHPDGVALVARRPDHRLAVFEPTDPALVLIGDAIEKPGNIGAILRTCDSFGAAFIGSSLKTDLENPNVVRAAQGSLFSSPIAAGERGEVIAWCTANTQVIVAHPGEVGTSLWDVDLKQPTSIVIGAEHEGVHPLWLEAGEHATIPVSGTADSLNASVTAAVFLAEAMRQRRNLQLLPEG
jgi:TrmH family RNA methyltransferase